MNASISSLKLSPFTHFIAGENCYTGVFNALNLGIVIVTNEIADMLKHNLILSIDQMKLLTRKYPYLITELMKQRILIPVHLSGFEDLNTAQQHLEHTPIGIIYLLLTDACNINCHYCYFEGAIPRPYKFTRMRPETVKKGLDLFVKIVSNAINHDLDEPQIILYGGEPFLNWEVMKFALNYIDGLIERKKIPSNTSVTINTNAILITDRIIKELQQYPFITVAVSIDGPQDIHDLQRVDFHARGTFDRVNQGINLLLKAGIKTGLCCTLSTHNIDIADKILLWLQKTYGIQSLGFNILLESPNLNLEDRDVYIKKVANKIISCFLIARNKGIYEDRIMRKVKSFVGGDIYFYDCGGCGQQIVISPDGQIGVCQAYCGTKKYFTHFSEKFNPVDHPYWKEWRKRSPINMPQCTKCVALGNCGGGCPYSADMRKGTIWAIDDTFCPFSREVIIFIIKDLIRKMIKKEIIS